MIHRVIVRRGSYHDSARLMRIARDLSAVPGVASADVMMGTPANVVLLAQAGLARADLQAVTPMDLVVALASDNADALGTAEGRLPELLAGGDAQPQAADERVAVRPGSVEEAVRLHPRGNLVSIAVPGAYAAFVANRALDAGRHVFLFSDNVAVDDEVALKTRGRKSGLLVMGPDCGTAIISGIRLGFANRVSRGPIGIVGASGTGTQEVCCLLARLGIGVSHAIGTGSRDLSTAVKGMMSEFALRLLADDADTKVVVLVAKNPAPEVANRLHQVLASLGKPAVVRYLGEPARPSADGVAYADTLDQAAIVAAERLGVAADASVRESERARSIDVRTLGRSGAPTGRVVGLFGGGSLASEAQYVLSLYGIVTSAPSHPLAPGQPIPGCGSLIVDTGDDAYTVGRPHPMVDQTVRCGLIQTAGADITVGLILLDLVLGDGAHPNPAEEIADAVAHARAARNDAPLAVVCSVCGTRDDPQDFARQVAALEAAGVQTEATAARAAHLAARLLGRAAHGSAR